MRELCYYFFGNRDEVVVFPKLEHVDLTTQIFERYNSYRTKKASFEVYFSLPQGTTHFDSENPNSMCLTYLVLADKVLELSEELHRVGVTEGERSFLVRPYSLRRILAVMKG